MKCSALVTIFTAMFASAAAFAPTKQTFINKSININSLQQASPTVEKPIAIENQRYSMAQVQTMSLFGLGGPELAVILIAAAFVLGPEKLAALGKDAGKIAGELKEVPKEFQKGLDEGEQQAMAMKKEISAADVEKVEAKVEVEEKVEEKASKE
jgi:sec-independent protein translocase protein TatA